MENRVARRSMLGNGAGWNFTQVPQLVLAGDSASPIA
jgi:hypothetical protein